MNNKRDNYKQ